MDWFLASVDDMTPSPLVKTEFNKVVNDIVTAKQRMYHKKSMDGIRTNDITAQLKTDTNYVNRMDTLLRLETLHVQKRVCEQLMDVAYTRSCLIGREIHEIEQNDIEPEFVDYVLASFPKRTYTVQGEKHTSYKGKIVWNKRVFTAMGAMVVYMVFFDSFVNFKF